MRTRFVVFVALLGALALSLPAWASAAPKHDHGLTIDAAPNPILAGEGVLIYGQLQGPDNQGQTIYLYHRVAPSKGFTLIGHTTTDSQGGYEFTRQEGVVLTNRSWYVRGPDATHSDTIHEQVAALVTLSSNRTETRTGGRIVFTGQVTPNHPFERVLLQQQKSANGNSWRTIASTYTNGNSHFSLSHAWARPGDDTVRALFRGDRRNTAGGSDSITIVVQQREKPAFTLATSAPVITVGHTAQLSGTLDKAGTTTPESGVQVTLYGRGPSGGFQAMGTTKTAADGSYSFTVDPAHNTVYRAVTHKPHRTSAPVSQGVRDVVTLNQSSDTAVVGGTVTFSGAVTPGKDGHAIFLQRLGRDGAWHDVAQTSVGSGSTYSFTYKFGQAGTDSFRTRIFGGPWNVGAASRVLKVAVSASASPE